MAEAEEEGVPGEVQQPQLSSSIEGAGDAQPSARTEEHEERPAEDSHPAERREERSAEDTDPAAHTEEPVERPAEDRPPVASLEERPSEDTHPAARSEEPVERPAEDSPPAASLEERPSEDTHPAARSEEPEERPAEGGSSPSQQGALSVVSPVLQFKLNRFFVLRPGTLNQAIKDVEALVDKEVDGSIHGLWLMAEVDHWNNEKERVVILTDNSLLVFKYDFVMFNCDQIQRIPLNFVDRICHGDFCFPKRSLLQRAGEGVRVFWDRLREPSFTSRWNPFANDFPFITFTQHPVWNLSDTFTALCDIDNFREKLKAAAEKAHVAKPVPGKANGVLLLNQNILIEAYVGLMSFLGNQNKLGYCMARGNLGF